LVPAGLRSPALLFEATFVRQVGVVLDDFDGSVPAAFTREFNSRHISGGEIQVAKSTDDARPA